MASSSVYHGGGGWGGWGGGGESNRTRHGRIRRRVLNMRSVISLLQAISTALPAFVLGFKQFLNRMLQTPNTIHLNNSSYPIVFYFFKKIKKEPSLGLGSLKDRV